MKKFKLLAGWLIMLSISGFMLYFIWPLIVIILGAMLLVVGLICGVVLIFEGSDDR